MNETVSNVVANATVSGATQLSDGLFKGLSMQIGGLELILLGASLLLLAFKARTLGNVISTYGFAIFGMAGVFVLLKAFGILG